VFVRLESSCQRIRTDARHVGRTRPRSTRAIGRSGQMWRRSTRVTHGGARRTASGYATSLSAHAIRSCTRTIRSDSSQAQRTVPLGNLARNVALPRSAPLATQLQKDVRPDTDPVLGRTQPAVFGFMTADCWRHWRAHRGQHSVISQRASTETRIARRLT
jgi:hypothetical protein